MGIEKPLDNETMLMMQIDQSFGQPMSCPPVCSGSCSSSKRQVQTPPGRSNTFYTELKIEETYSPRPTRKEKPNKEYEG